MSAPKPLNSFTYAKNLLDVLKKIEIDLIVESSELKRSEKNNELNEEMIGKIVNGETIIESDYLNFNENIKIFRGSIKYVIDNKIIDSVAVEAIREFHGFYSKLNAFKEKYDDQIDFEKNEFKTISTKEDEVQDVNLDINTLQDDLININSSFIDTFLALETLKKNVFSKKESGTKILLNVISEFGLKVGSYILSSLNAINIFKNKNGNQNEKIENSEIEKDDKKTLEKINLNIKIQKGIGFAVLAIGFLISAPVILVTAIKKYMKQTDREKNIKSMLKFVDDFNSPEVKKEINSFSSEILSKVLNVNKSFLFEFINKTFVSEVRKDTAHCVKLNAQLNVCYELLKNSNSDSLDYGQLEKALILSIDLLKKETGLSKEDKDSKLEAIKFVHNSLNLLKDCSGLKVRTDLKVDENIKALDIFLSKDFKSIHSGIGEWEKNITGHPKEKTKVLRERACDLLKDLKKSPALQVENPKTEVKPKK